ncbi:MAG: hypothetical protein HZB51_16695 [Chloroflexi bacterium]|nr:hypothetical protein [Chloroflexota bacterium]
MSSRKNWFIVLALTMLIALILLSFGSAPIANAQGAASQRFIAIAKSDADLSTLRAEALKAGGEDHP